MNNQQLSLPLDIVVDASLDDFFAPSFAPIISAINSLYQGKFHELYLFGERGVGKSYLLSAIYTHASEMGKNAIFLSLSDMIDSQPQALLGLEFFDMVLLDDLQVISRHGNWQEALFHLINRLQENQKQLILTSSLPLREMNIELLDLATRLGQMLSINIPNANHIEDKKAFIHAIQRQHGWQFPDAIIAYFLEHGPDKVADIKQVLERISPHFTHLSKSQLSKKALDHIKSLIDEEVLLLELADIDEQYQDIY